MTETPSPFQRRIALALLAKAEGKPAARLRLDARMAPELHGHTDAEERARWWLQLQELERRGWWRLQLAPAREFADLAERKPQLELLDFEALAAWVGYQPLASRWAARWQALLQERGAPEALRQYLARNPLPALEPLAPEQAWHSLQQLAQRCQSGQRLALRELSAQVFQGRSKLLDAREELLLLLGAQPGQFSEAPIQLLIDCPARIEYALFVENLTSFEALADARGAAWQHALLLYAAGFKGSARRLREPAGCRLYLRAGSAAPQLDLVQRWLFERAELPVCFFGDLDYAGLDILRRLRELFPQAQAWAPGYRALARRLAAGGGHAPEWADKQQQADPGTTGCALADTELLPLLRRSGAALDQECLDAAALQAAAS